MPPCHRISAGRTNKKKVMKADTGLPGKPKKSFPSQRPKAKGRPGRMDTFQNCNSPPSCSKASLIKSISPTETPPEVTTRSHSLKAVVNAACVAARGIFHQPITQGPPRPGRRGRDRSDALVNLAGRQPGRPLNQLRTAGEQTHHRTPAHGRLGESGRGEQSQAGGGQVRSGFSQYRAFFYILAAKPDIFPRLGGIEKQDRAGMVGMRPRVLLRHDGIRAAGQRRTGEYPHAIAGCNFAAEDSPGGHPARWSRSGTGDSTARLRSAHQRREQHSHPWRSCRNPADRQATKLVPPARDDAPGQE